MTWDWYRLLRSLAEEAADRADLKTNVTLPENIESLTPDIEQSIYRIAQESITNVINHAGAKNLKLEMTQSAGRILCWCRMTALV